MIFRNIIGIALIIAGLDVLLNVRLWHYFWPLVLIFVGIYLLFNKTAIGEKYMTEMGTVEQSQLNLEAIFAPLNKKVVTDNFEGGKVTTVFGGGVLDLREAKIKDGEEVDLELDAVFGGIKLIIPKEWELRSSLSAVAGGFTEKVSKPSGKNPPKLNLKGSVVFGGGEVVNE